MVEKKLRIIKNLIHMSFKRSPTRKSLSLEDSPIQRSYSEDRVNRLSQLIDSTLSRPPVLPAGVSPGKDHHDPIGDTPQSNARLSMISDYAGSIHEGVPIQYVVEGTNQDNSSSDTRSVSQTSRSRASLRLISSHTGANSISSGNMPSDSGNSHSGHSHSGSGTASSQASYYPGRQKSSLKFVQEETELPLETSRETREPDRVVATELRPTIPPRSRNRPNSQLFEGDDVELAEQQNQYQLHPLAQHTRSLTPEQVQSYQSNTLVQQLLNPQSSVDREQPRLDHPQPHMDHSQLGDMGAPRPQLYDRFSSGPVQPLRLNSPQKHRPSPSQNSMTTTDSFYSARDTVGRASEYDFEKDETLLVRPLPAIPNRSDTQRTLDAFVSELTSRSDSIKEVSRENTVRRIEINPSLTAPRKDSRDSTRNSSGIRTIRGDDLEYRDSRRNSRIEPRADSNPESNVTFIEARTVSNTGSIAESNMNFHTVDANDRTVSSSSTSKEHRGIARVNSVEYRNNGDSRRNSRQESKSTVRSERPVSRDFDKDTSQIPAVRTENMTNMRFEPVKETTERSTTPTPKSKKKAARKSKRSSGNFDFETISQMLNVTKGTLIGSEFANLGMRAEEKRSLERLVDSLSRLTADMVLDPDRFEEGLRRLNKATKALEGF